MNIVNLVNKSFAYLMYTRLTLIFLSIYLTSCSQLKQNKPTNLNYTDFLADANDDFTNSTDFVKSNKTIQLSNPTHKHHWIFADVLNISNSISELNSEHVKMESVIFYQFPIELLYGISESNTIINSTKGIPVHIPYFKWKSSYLEGFLQPTPGNYIPRRAIIKSHLPTLPLEPFQRILTFAIEHCLIPDVWLLESLYCMYSSAAIYLNGVVMSYTLQDLTGAALFSLDYKTEEFLIEHCFKAVELFTDDVISARSIEICNSMFHCLNQKPFLSQESSKLLSNIKTRIANAFKNALPYKELDGTSNHLLFAKYSLFLSISLFKKSKKEIDKFSLDRSYIIIRSMNTALALRALAIKHKCFAEICSDYSIALNAFKLVNKLKNLNHKMALEKCINIFLSINLFIAKNSMSLAMAFCVDVLSLGFIDEKIELPSHLNPAQISKAIMPSAILSKGYLNAVSTSECDNLFLFNLFDKNLETNTDFTKQKLIKKRNKLSRLTRRKVTPSTSRAHVKSSLSELSIEDVKMTQKKTRTKKLRTLFTRSRKFKNSNG